jgi:hypothetical protein
MRVVKCLVVLMTIAAFPVTAQTPAFDPRGLKNAHAGPPTQVLTLGSAHLSELPANFRTDMLAPLIDKLAAFKPDIITHEGIAGEQCDVLKRYAARYPEMFDTYCRDSAEAEKAIGLTVPAAMAEIEKTLAAWPANPTAAQRRRLAGFFLAANDRPSAQVQWLRLPAVERKTGDGIDDALLKILTRAGASPNETFEVGVVLAARLGLERVYAVDDHTADSVQGLAGPGFEAAIQKIWNGPPFAEGEEYGRRSKALTNGTDLLEFFRFINRPGTQRAFIAGDFGKALKDATPELYGRQYVAWYEVRNLRMVANVRAAIGNRPGARVLNIVGASHKGYYDTYLDMMSDVQLVDAEAVLR